MYDYSYAALMRMTATPSAAHKDVLKSWTPEQAGTGIDPNGVRALLNELTRDSKRDEAYECTATGDALPDEIKRYRAIELWGEGFDRLDKKRYNDPIERVSFTNGGSSDLLRP